MLQIPQARGVLSQAVCDRLGRPAGGSPHWPAVDVADPLTDDDLQLALTLCYELHYRGIEDVDPMWEWDPALLRFRRCLEDPFEAALRHDVGPVPVPDGPSELSRILIELSSDVRGPSLSKQVAREASLGQFREFVAHRSIYTLKEADPHSFMIPRISGAAKAALVEIQADEYGGGDIRRMHSELFARTMSAVGLDPTYGAYLNVVPGVTLGTVNLVSMFGLHRRLRGAAMGHLALFELTSATPSRRYANGLRRLGFGEEATHYYDEHVEADSVHSLIAAYDLAEALLAEDAGIGSEILFGAMALDRMEELFANYLLDAWQAERSSLQGALLRVAAASR
jgi:hypothetical protein